MSNQQPRKFNFKTISIVLTAIVGIALMLLGRFIIQGTASTLWVNDFINGDAFLSVMNCELALSLVVRGVGVGLFVYSMYRAYFTRQSFTFRTFKKTLILSSLLCLVVIMGSTLVEAPLVAADKVNTISQGYKICTSMSFYDFWIGKLSDNTYFAMRGSDGNVLTFVEPWQATAPWAAYASNYTALEQQVFASISYGTVYSKEVPLNYALTIPQNITFIESVNGLDRRFISSLSSQGSPYTVSVDTVNSGYYLAQDSAGRYIVSWSSLDCASIVNTISALGNRSKDVTPLTIQFGQSTSNYTIQTGIQLYSNTILDGNGATIVRAANANFVGITNIDHAVGNFGIEIKDLTIASGLGGTEDLINFINPSLYGDDSRGQYGLYQLEISNVKVICTESMRLTGNGIYLKYIVPKIEFVEIYGVNLNGLYMYACSDAQTNNVRITQSTGYTLRVDYGNANMFNQYWLTGNAHGLMLNQTTKNILNHFWMWNSSAELVYIYGSQYAHLTDFSLFAASQAGNASAPYVAMYSQADCVLSSFLCTRHATETIFPSYGVYEDTNCLRNNYIGFSVRSITAPMLIRATCNATAINTIPT